MANLEFCDTHNMVAYLHKIEGSEGFHQIQTAAANTLDSREVQITATIDGKVKLVSEASIRRHLKLEDSDGITTLPNTKIFEQLTLMGVKDQQSQLTDEVAFISVDVVHGGAATTVSSIDTGQGSSNIPKSPIMPLDSPLLGGHTPRSDEGSMILHELTVKKLEQTVKTSQARRRAKIVALDDEDSSKDTSKKERTIEDIDPDARISLVTPKKVSSQEDQSKDQLGVLSAAKVLADAAKKNVNTYTKRKRAVSTGSEGVSTASRIFSIAEESLLASETTKDEANPPVADIDWDDVQAQIQANEGLAQKLLEEERENLSIEERARLLAELIDKRKKLQAAQ
ncbi:hypothetical protein Tco_0291120 [Tanacetum coccineum]